MRRVAKYCAFGLFAALLVVTSASAQRSQELSAILEKADRPGAVHFSYNLDKALRSSIEKHSSEIPERVAGETWKNEWKEVSLDLQQFFLVFADEVKVDRGEVSETKPRRFVSAEPPTTTIFRPALFDMNEDGKKRASESKPLARTKNVTVRIVDKIIIEIDESEIQHKRFLFFVKWEAKDGKGIRAGKGVRIGEWNFGPIEADLTPDKATESGSVSAQTKAANQLKKDPSR